MATATKTLLSPEQIAALALSRDSMISRTAVTDKTVNGVSKTALAVPATMVKTAPAPAPVKADPVGAILEPVKEVVTKTVETVAKALAPAAVPTKEAAVATLSYASAVKTPVATTTEAKSVARDVAAILSGSGGGSSGGATTASLSTSTALFSSTPLISSKTVERVPSAPAVGNVPVPLELRDAYLKWRGNLDGRVYSGTVADIQAPSDLWQRFVDARERIGLLISVHGLTATGLSELAYKWWARWDPDGAAALDPTVAPASPPRYKSGVKTLFPRVPTTVASLVQLQAQRHGATDAVEANPGADALDHAVGFDLLREARAASAGAGGGGMQSEAVSTTGPTCPDGRAPWGRDTATGGYLCSGGVIVDASGTPIPSAVPEPVVPPPPTAIAYAPPTSSWGALFTPRNLAIGGGIALLVWLLFFRKKHR